MNGHPTKPQPLAGFPRDAAAAVHTVLADTLQANAEALRAAVERVKREGYSHDEPTKTKHPTQTLPSVSPLLTRCPSRTRSWVTTPP